VTERERKMQSELEEAAYHSGTLYWPVMDSDGKYNERLESNSSFVSFD